jgi:TolB-like protein
MPDVFLSYSREDQATARRFAEALERAGLSVWWDQTLRSGDAYDEVTEQALKSAKAVVVLWSKRSVASRWVRAEATIADRAGTLVPAMIEPCERPVMFELRQTADLSEWKGNPQDRSWVAFLGDLRAATGGSNLPADQAAAEGSGGKPIASRGRWKVAVALAATALVGAGGWMLLQKSRGQDPASGVATAQRPAHDQTLAVLPFVNLSSDPQQEYFVDGLTEELLNSLASVPGLSVTGRTSAFFFKGKNEDMKVIGEKLGVENLLEGSVRKDGEMLRIVAQLVKAKDGFHLWSQTYNRPATDIFKVQEEIAKSVTDTLQISLGVGDLGRMPGMTRDVAAWQAYAEARSLTGSNLDIANRQMERLQFAVERDPTFMFAWLALAGQYRGRSNVGDPNAGQAKEFLRKANDAVAQAVRVSPDPRLALALGEGVNFQRGEWKAVEIREPRRWALIEEFKLQPMLGSRPSVLDLYNMAEDKPERPIEAMEGARVREPLDQRIAVNLGLAYAIADRMPDAIAEDRRGLAMAPNTALSTSHLLSAKAYGDPAILEQAWKTYVSTPGTDAFAARLYELRDKPTEALAELGKHGPVSSLWAAFFGDYQLSLERLKAENAPERRWVVGFNIWRPIMAPVRKLPGFKDLVRDLGLVDYWREFGWGQHCKPVGDTDFTCT